MLLGRASLLVEYLKRAVRQIFGIFRVVKIKKKGHTNNMKNKGGISMQAVDMVGLKRKNPEVINLQSLQDPGMIINMQMALEQYKNELENKGYSALTISSYTSAINRFIDFLKLGEVVPEERTH